MEEEDNEIVVGEQENNGRTDQDQHDVGLPDEEGWEDVQIDPPEIPFISNSGIKVVIPSDASPIDLFSLFWNDNVMELIVNETNRYASTFMNNPNVTRNSKISRWKPLNILELNIF